MAAKKKRAASKAAKRPASGKKRLKDPKGGLTEAGRKDFAKKEGSQLKPGVKGKADTPEKMRRKGSFLRRHFAHPRGPMVDDKGEPTRLALSAHAWGEPVPKTMAAAKKLAAKGAKLLERYAKAKSTAKTKTSVKTAKRPSGKTSAKTAKRPSGKTSAKKTAAKKKKRT